MVTYKVIDNELKNLDSDLLNSWVEDGWDIFQIVPYHNGWTGSRVKIILKR